MQVIRIAKDWRMKFKETEMVELKKSIRTLKSRTYWAKIASLWISAAMKDYIPLTGAFLQ